jgi:hypothetical protein
MEYEQENSQDDAISQDADTAYTFDNSLHQAFGLLNSPLSEQEDPLPSLPLFQDAIPPTFPHHGGLDPSIADRSVDNNVGASDGDLKPAAKQVQQKA